jgi:hypothetical protein
MGSKSSGTSIPDRHRLTDEERDKRITNHSSQSAPPTQDDRNDGEMGPMHTNAGSTGFSSDQISPKTQNMPQTGPSASHPAHQNDSSDRKA